MAKARYSLSLFVSAIAEGEFIVISNSYMCCKSEILGNKAKKRFIMRANNLQVKFRNEGKKDKQWFF